MFESARYREFESGVGGIHVECENNPLHSRVWKIKKCNSRQEMRYSANDAEALKREVETKLMTKKKVINRVEDITPIPEIITAKEARDVLEVDENVVINRKVNEISELLFYFENMSEDEKNVRIVRALELFESLEPLDGMESMLAAQMVATHFAALDCLRRAALNNQTFEGRNVSLTQAQKLMSLYTKQLATLDKHRGKGQQKVTVEHVNVAAGGQAIVGNVETGRRTLSGTISEESSPNTIEHTPDVPLPEVRSKNAAARKKR